MDHADGYQVSITFHRDFSYAVIQRIPDGEARTITHHRLPDLLVEMAHNPTQATLRDYFLATPARSRMESQ